MFWVLKWTVSLTRNEFQDTDAPTVAKFTNPHKQNQKHLFCLLPPSQQLYGVGKISWSTSTKEWDWTGIKRATLGSTVRHAPHSVARHVTDCSKRPKGLTACFLPILLRGQKFHWPARNHKWNLERMSYSSALGRITPGIHITYCSLLHALLKDKGMCLQDEWKL